VLTIRNSAGHVVVSEPVSFCPNTYVPERASPGAPPTTPYPPQCLSDPFVKGMVWGIQKGWATDPIASNLRLRRVKLAVGNYQMTETVAPPGYRRLLRISARDATATVKVKVVKGPRCCPIPGSCLPSTMRRSHGTAPRPPTASVRTMTQFARYTLLNAAKSTAVTSHKVGFCIGPSDEVDLLLPHATWRPAQEGPPQDCGSPTALWVDEKLPLGWGDTYFQSVAGQSFDITHVPNGTYYVQVTANPERLLYETSTRNDVPLRKVILGGTPGHRTVKVPAWHGIDPEP
jgi:Lysyl oxidase